MTHGLTDSGFKAKKFVDLLADSAVGLKRELGIDIDTNPNAIAKVITNIFSLALSEPWAAIEDMQSMFDIDSAEGKHLDDLVGYVRMERIPAKAAAGNLYLTLDVASLLVPKETAFLDAVGNEYLSQSNLTVGLENNVTTVLKVKDIAVLGNILTVVVTDISFSETITAAISTTVTALVTKINTRTLDTGVVATDTTSGTDASITLTKTNDTTTVNMGYSGALELVSTTSIIPVVKTIFSSDPVNVGAVDTIPDLAGTVSVTNRYKFAASTAIESDASLRARHKAALSSGGKSTVDAIYSGLSQLSGVSTVIINENATSATNTEGLPSNSVQCVIKGGTEAEIAQALWDNKPAGIQTYGAITSAAKDLKGNTQFVRYSTPTPNYVHLQIDYTLHPEDQASFPSDGEAQMVTLLLNYCNTLGLGKDVIPQRLSSVLFNKISGLEEVTVSVGSTLVKSDPIPVLSTSRLSVSSLAEGYYSTTRVVVNKV